MELDRWCRGTKCGGRRAAFNETGPVSLRLPVRRLRRPRRSVPCFGRERGKIALDRIAKNGPGLYGPSRWS